MMVLKTAMLYIHFKRYESAFIYTQPLLGTSSQLTAIFIILVVFLL